MKKSLLIAAACVALVSCAKDEAAVPKMNASDSKITFEQPIVNPVTRANNYGEIAGIEYPTTENFIVHGRWYANEYTNWAEGTLYMGNETNGLEVAHDAANDHAQATGKGGWDTATDYYFPKDGSLTFQAYSPAAYTLTSTAAFTQYGVTFTEYEIGEVKAQYDVMYSDRSYNRKAAVTSWGDDNATYDGVEIKFNHALSSIIFNAQTLDDYSGAEITLLDITLKNVYKKGSFCQNLVDANNETTDNPVWNPVGGWGDYTGILEAAKVIDENVANDFCNDLLVMPQDFTDQTKIVINYTIKSTDSTPISQKFEAQLNQYTYDDGQGNTPAFKKFEMGKRYIFNIVVGLEKIYFAPEVVDWTTVTVHEPINGSK